MNAKFKCKLKVFQSIVSSMQEKDLVYSIQHFPNQHKSQQLLIWMMDVNDLVVMQIMWLIARVKLPLTLWSISYGHMDHMIYPTRKTPKKLRWRSNRGNYITINWLWTAYLAQLYSESNNWIQVRLAFVIYVINFMIGTFKNISSWWTGRDSKNHTYWHGNASENATGCACASTGSCERFVNCINVSDKRYRQKVMVNYNKIKFLAIPIHKLNATVTIKRQDS